ncbi:MAG: phosphate ABC transporter permease PstA [Minwuiales bacterium]|nr:phosphate ABC transporter permease PstA [Minwuiales bacterium]
MTDLANNSAPRQTSERIAASLPRRYARDSRFRYYGMVAIGLALAFLVLLFVSIVSKGYTAFFQTEIRLLIEFDEDRLDPNGTRDPSVLASADYGGLVRTTLRGLFPEATSRRDRRSLNRLMSSGAGFVLRDMVIEDPSLIGTTQEVWLPASADIDMLIKGFIDRNVPASERRVNDNQIAWVDALQERGAIERHFNIRFFTAGDSREPELAGIWGAVVGSFYTLLVAIVLAFPLGVMTAIYLEEFAPTNRWTDLIEVNINNLAAVPSIVFGLLGLAVFLNFFGLPRSAPLVGGMVLALMTLPTIIIAGRAALKAVPPSIREAALGVGASRLQVVTHHVLPLAMPGILTGAIIGAAQALGESAPLLMIGMVAFIVDVPSGPIDPATVLPVQIYLWADSPERAFVERTSAGIMVLIAFLVAMNLLAVVLRKKFERRW